MAVVRAHAKGRVKRPFAENGWRVPRARCRASPPLGVTARRLGLFARAVALSNMASGWRSFDRPVQHANGAVAPVCLCDHGAAARGSFATLYGQDRILFSQGVLPHWGSTPRRGVFRGLGLNGSGSFEHPRDLLHVGVGFVERSRSNGGAQWHRRRWQHARVGLNRSHNVARRARRLGSLESLCSRGRSVRAGLLRRTV